MDAVTTTTLVVLSVFSVGYFVRFWLEKKIEAATREASERALEGIRSDLRLKEAALTALQARALDGQAGVQSQISQRRLEAIDRLWAETLKLEALRSSASMVQILKLDEIEKRAKSDPKVAEFTKILAGPDGLERL